MKPPVSRCSASVKSQLLGSSFVTAPRRTETSVPLRPKSCQQNRRIIEDGLDVTPKPLTMTRQWWWYGATDEDRRFSGGLEIVDSPPSGASNSHRSIASSFTSFSLRSTNSCSTSTSPASSGSASSLRHHARRVDSLMTSGVAAEPTVEELRTESSSLLTTEASTSNDLFRIRSDQLNGDQHTNLPLSSFRLSSHDPTTTTHHHHLTPDVVGISLKETETYFILELPRLLDDIYRCTADETVIRQDNEGYADSITDHGIIRKMANAVTQTIRVLAKTRGTYLARGERFNRGTYVTNWVMHDDYALLNSIDKAENGHRWKIIVVQEEPKRRVRATSEGTESRNVPFEERFRAVSLLMEGLIANNLYAEAQKRYNGLIAIDRCSPEMKFHYGLRLLWEHKCPVAAAAASAGRGGGRPISSFRWNYATATVLAVAYGSVRDSPTTNKDDDDNDGLLSIWCMKNPSRPGRTYTFNSPVADIDWSRDRPNWLAVGLYDGTVRVLDISSDATTTTTTTTTTALNATKSIRRSAGTTRSPKWQVQWWREEAEDDDERLAAHHQEELIYTCDQDGRVLRYRPAESDFTFIEITRISRIEGTPNGGGVRRTSSQPRCAGSNVVPISRNPGASLLRRHPSQDTIYFVGSDEGCLYRCSTNYLNRHIESFLAHDGPVYSMEFSPYCSKIFLTCGADWCTRVWIEGLEEPLVTLRTSMACVRCATWSPTNSTVIASIVDNEICLWDMKRKTHSPASIMVSPEIDRFVKIGFTPDGNQLVVGDSAGTMRVYDLEGMPFPPYHDQQKVLVEAIERSLAVKPLLRRKLKTLGPPF